MKEEEPAQKRAKSKPPKPNVEIPPVSAASRVSFYGDPTKTYANEDERRRAEIQKMMRFWKHYSTALTEYASIYSKTSDDLRGMRECHEELSIMYAEGRLFSLVVPHYIGALKCCLGIPEKEKKQEDLDAIARIFPKLIQAVNGMIESLSLHHEQVRECLVFCNTNYLGLNFKQRYVLDLSGVDMAALEAFKKHPWGEERRSMAQSIIDLVTQSLPDDVTSKRSPGKK